MEQTEEQIKINNINNELKAFCKYYIKNILKIDKLTPTQKMLIEEFYYIKNSNGLEITKAFADYIATIKE